MDSRLLKVMEALEANGMSAYYAEDRTEAVETVRKLLKKGDTVAVGGSVSLQEAGVLDLLRNGDYIFYDRYAYTKTEEIKEIYKKSLSVDTFLCSSNAVTEEGNLYNVDGNSNRVSAILYGPKSVIMVVGVNKLVKNIDEAVERVRTVAAPLNAKRLGIKTYCYDTGKCVASVKGNKSICGGCESEGRICRNYVISGPQKEKGRIKIVLVNEKLGY